MMEMQLCCGCAPPVLVDWNRAMEIVGPLTDDATLADYGTSWSFGYVGAIGVNAWRFVLPNTPDDTPVGTQGHWNRKLQPLRFQLSTAAAQLLFQYDEISETAVPFSGSAVLMPPLFQPPPSSAVGPPADGHFRGSKTADLSVSMPFGAPGNFATRVRAVRILVDGVDVSGVITKSLSFGQQQISNGFFNIAETACPITPTVVTEKAVEVDIWIELDITLPVGVSLDGRIAAWAFPGTHAGRYANVAPHWKHFIRGVGALDSNARRAVSRPYRFDFSSAISGGITTATTDDGSPWTITRNHHSVKLAHSDENDAVELIYGQEIAEIIVTQYQQHTPDIFRLWRYRYFPADTGHYGGYSGLTPGVFRPNGSQTFVLVGYNASGSGSEDWNLPIPAIAAWCPATVTVSPP